MCAADAAVAEALSAAGLQVHSFNGLLLQEPWEVQVRAMCCSFIMYHSGMCI